MCLNIDNFVLPFTYLVLLLILIEKALPFVLSNKMSGFFISNAHRPIQN